MFPLLLILLICTANFAIGFGLAMHNGHGPPSLPLVGGLISRMKSRGESKANGHEAH